MLSLCIFPACSDIVFLCSQFRTLCLVLKYRSSPSNYMRISVDAAVEIWYMVPWFRKKSVVDILRTKLLPRYLRYNRKNFSDRTTHDVITQRATVYTCPSLVPSLNSFTRYFPLLFHYKYKTMNAVCVKIRCKKKKGKAFPLQAWTGPWGSRRLRLQNF
jgi:hypothetical protein